MGGCRVDPFPLPLRSSCAKVGSYPPSCFLYLGCVFPPPSFLSFISFLPPLSFLSLLSFLSFPPGDSHSRLAGAGHEPLHRLDHPRRPHHGRTVLRPPSLPRPRCAPSIVVADCCAGGSVRWRIHVMYTGEGFGGVHFLCQNRFNSGCFPHLQFFAQFPPGGFLGEFLFLRIGVIRDLKK